MNDDHDESRELRTLTHKTRDVVVTNKRALKMDTPDIVLCQSGTHSIHANMTKTAVSKQGVGMEMGKRERSRRRRGSEQSLGRKRSSNSR